LYEEKNPLKSMMICK